MPQDWQGFYESPAIDELIAQPPFSLVIASPGWDSGDGHYRFGPELP